MKDLFGNLTKGACFSRNRDHRFWLFRMWDASKPCIAFIGLNPSTANEHSNDNTITKVTKIAANNGYGSFYMLNLFSCVTSNPEEIVDTEYTLNSYWLSEYGKGDVVFCWGNFKQAEVRAGIISKMFPRAFCIARNKNGSPKHPLYCKDKSKLQLFY